MDRFSAKFPIPRKKSRSRGCENPGDFCTNCGDPRPGDFPKNVRDPENPKIPIIFFSYLTRFFSGKFAENCIAIFYIFQARAFLQLLIKLPAQLFIFEIGSRILFCFSQPHFGAAELDLSQSATRPINICLWRSRHVLPRKFSRKSSKKLKIYYYYVCNITKNNNPNPIGKNPVASVQYLNFK